VAAQLMSTTIADHSWSFPAPCYIAPHHWTFTVSDLRGWALHCLEGGGFIRMVIVKFTGIIDFGLLFIKVIVSLNFLFATNPVKFNTSLVIADFTVLV